MDKSMMVYRQNPEFVCWDNIELIFEKYYIEVKAFEKIMEECYGGFVGDDWKIATADLILKIEARKQ